MKMRKILAAIAAGAIACSAMAVSAFAAEDYKGYFQFQTDTSWYYRDAWNHSSNGLGSDVFAQINAGEEKVGTITDVDITGDGTYTVKVEGLDDLDLSGEHISILGVSTNIPYDASLVITNVITTFDGAVVNTAETYELDPESKDEYLSIMAINSWADLDFKPAAPTSSMEVTFTIAGLDGDAAEDDKKDEPADDKKDDPADDKKDEPADDKKEDDKKDDTSTKNPTTGATAGLALAGLALAGAAIVVTKKND